MVTFRVLSALLRYPTRELRAETAEAERILREESLLSDGYLEVVCAFIRDLGNTPQLELESAYIEAFDRGRSTSLYLLEHIHGESRDRGQAMVKLLMRYRMHGLELQSGELPDFLPIFLEFLSTCSLKEARKHLLEVADIVGLIGQRLRKRGAAYAPVLEAIASLVPRNIDEQSPANSNLEDRDDTPAALDAAWEESPVTFNDAVFPASQPLVNAASQSRLTKTS
jgi:nitrate reductase molybdenum cofactor assembly chaperone NarJ/NarW